MSQQEQPSKAADWMKWAVGLAWAALAVLIPYVLNVEHRLTAAESAQATTAAAVQQQKQDGEKILTAITAVQVEVAKINGYLESRKNPQN